MVNFSIFNELSLPLEKYTAEEKFEVFFNLLKQLQKKGLTKIRMSDDFKNYQILNSTTFQQFFGQQKNKEFKDRLRSFISHSITKIDTPIVKTSETKETETQQNNEYHYNNQLIDGGLACCDVWSTIAISFDATEKWRKANIGIEKRTLNKTANIVTESIQIKHASKVSHLSSHTTFFDELEREGKLKITQENFWQQKEKSFPRIVVFCPEVESKIKSLGEEIFKQAISILREVETGRKKITDYNWSPESRTVSQNPKLKQHRTFTIDGEKMFIENHIKSLPSKHRIYFFENNNKVYIGYIGKHLPL